MSQAHGSHQPLSGSYNPDPDKVLELVRHDLARAAASLGQALDAALAVCNNQAAAGRRADPVMIATMRGQADRTALLVQDVIDELSAL